MKLTAKFMCPRQVCTCDKWDLENTLLVSQTIKEAVCLPLNKVSKQQHINRKVEG